MLTGPLAYLAYRACTETAKWISEQCKKNNK